MLTSCLRMMIIYIAMIIFSSSVGRWVERSPDRLRTLQSTIICNRVSVVLASFFWLLMLSQENLLISQVPGASTPRYALPRNDTLKDLIFVTAVTFGIIERLSSFGNFISMERDWVVTVAAPAGHPYDLTNLNAVMRRIDVVCKLISPILISIVISTTGSVRIGVLYTGFMSLLSVPVELLSAKRVWNSSTVLQIPKPIPDPVPTQRRPVGETKMESWVRESRQYLQGLEMYFGTPAWIPSFALAMLHFNLLTYDH